MYEQLQIDPPREIPDFLDHLHATGQRVVPGSLIWVPHPTKPGWMIAAVTPVPSGDCEALMEDRGQVVEKSERSKDESYRD